MVPPLRRFSSIAYDVHSPSSSSDHDEVDGEPTEDTELGQPLGDGEGVLGDHPRVRGIGREHAAEIALAAGAAQHLVVGRQSLDRPVGQHPELDAGAEQLPRR